jgi:hypothetical protein
MGDGERALRSEGQPELETLQQKVEFMVNETFPGQKVSGRHFSDLVKAKGGLLSHSHFSNILAGKVTDPGEETYRALGLGFGCDWQFFKPESELVDEVVAHLTFLARRRSGEITGIAGRGVGEAGLPGDLLKLAMSLMDEALKQQRTRSGEQIA